MPHPLEGSVPVLLPPPNSTPPQPSPEPELGSNDVIGPCRPQLLTAYLHQSADLRTQLHLATVTSGRGLSSCPFYRKETD